MQQHSSPTTCWATLSDGSFGDGDNNNNASIQQVASASASDTALHQLHIFTQPTAGTAIHNVAGLPVGYPHHHHLQPEANNNNTAFVSKDITSELVDAALQAADDLVDRGILLPAAATSTAIVPATTHQEQQQQLLALPFAPEQLAALTVNSIHDFYNTAASSPTSPTTATTRGSGRHQSHIASSPASNAFVSVSPTASLDLQQREDVLSTTPSTTTTNDGDEEDNNDRDVFEDEKHGRNIPASSGVVAKQQHPPTQVTQHDRPIPFNPLLLPDLNVPPPNFAITETMKKKKKKTSESHHDEQSSAGSLEDEVQREEEENDEDEDADPHKLQLDLPWNPLDSSMGLVELLGSVEAERHRKHDVDVGAHETDDVRSQPSSSSTSTTPIPPAVLHSSAPALPLTAGSNTAAAISRQLLHVSRIGSTGAVASSVGVIGEASTTTGKNTTNSTSNSNRKNTSNNKIPDIFAPAEDLKRLLMSPLTKEPLAMLVHRVGNSILCEGGLISPHHGARTVKEARKRSLLTKLLYYSVLGVAEESTNNSNEKQQPPTVPPPSSHGEEEEGELKDDDKQNKKSKNKEQDLPTRRLPHQSPPPLSTKTPHFKRSLKWDLDDLSVMLGVNVPVLENPTTKERLTVQIHDAEDPVGELEALEYWLDNDFANVPRVAICYHKEGVVQGYQIVSTDKLPELAAASSSASASRDEHGAQEQERSNVNENKSKNKNKRSFEPMAVRMHTSRVLKWLKESCTRPSGTYVLVKDQRDNALKLYDVSGFHGGGDGDDDVCSASPSATGMPSSATTTSSSSAKTPKLVAAAAPPATNETMMLLEDADDSPPPMRSWNNTGGEGCGHGSGGGGAVQCSRYRPFTYPRLGQRNSTRNAVTSSHTSPSSSSSLQVSSSSSKTSPFSVFVYPLAMMCYRMAQCLHASDAEGHRLRLKCIGLLGDAADIYDCAMSAPPFTSPNADVEHHHQEASQQLLPGHDRITWGMLDVLYVLAAAHVQCVDYYLASCPLPDADESALQHSRRALEALYRISLTLARCEKKRRASVGASKKEDAVVEAMPAVYTEEAQRLSLQILKSLVSMSLRFAAVFRDANAEEECRSSVDGTTAATTSSSVLSWKPVIEPLLLVQKGLALFKDALPAGLLTAGPQTERDNDEDEDEEQVTTTTPQQTVLPSSSSSVTRRHVLATIAAVECLMGNFFAAQLQTLEACLEEEENAPQDKKLQEREKGRKESSCKRGVFERTLEEVCRLVELDSRSNSNDGNGKSKDARDYDEDDDHFLRSIPDHIDVVGKILPLSTDAQTIFDRGVLCFTRAINHTLQISPLEAATVSSSSTMSKKKQKHLTPHLQEEVRMMRRKVGTLHSQLANVLSRQLAVTKVRGTATIGAEDEKETFASCAQHYEAAKRIFLAQCDEQQQQQQQHSTFTNFCLMATNEAKMHMRLAEKNFGGDKFAMSCEERKHIDRAVSVLQSALSDAERPLAAASSLSSSIAVVENTLAAVCFGGANRCVSSFLEHAAGLDTTSEILAALEDIHTSFFVPAIRCFKKQKNNALMESRTQKMMADFFSFLLLLFPADENRVAPSSAFEVALDVLVSPAAAMIPPEKLRGEQAREELNQIRNTLRQAGRQDPESSEIAMVVAFAGRCITRYRHILMEMPPALLPALLPSTVTSSPSFGSFTPLDLQAALTLRLCDLHSFLLHSCQKEVDEKSSGKKVATTSSVDDDTGEQHQQVDNCERIVTILLQNAFAIVRAIESEAQKETEREVTGATNKPRSDKKKKKDVALPQQLPPPGSLPLLKFRLGVLQRYLEHWHKSLVYLAQTMKQANPHLSTTTSSSSKKEKEIAASYALLKESVEMCVKAKIASSGGANPEDVTGISSLITNLAAIFQQIAQNISRFLSNRKATGKK